MFMKKLLVAIVVGAILGFTSSRFLFVGSWLSLIPWGIAGLALGAWCERREALIDGAVYGFVIAFVFMLSGYSGSASMISRVPFFVIIGVVGAVCGLVLGFLGYMVKEFLTRGKRRSG
jgi:hypothetical protein